jgi:hypothetical protein
MDWQQIGERWLRGEVIIKEFNGFHLNPKQIEFVNNKEPEELISGGFRSGKTIALAIKLWLMCMFFPDNRVLLGRKTRSDIESATLPTLFDVFPAGSYTYKVGPGIIEFPNGSQILLYGLDMLVSGDDTGKSAQKIKGIDLGGVFIDQLEEVEAKMYEILSSRLSRKKVPFRPVCCTTNPANFWAYDYFKVQPAEDKKLRRFLIETGMADNAANLPEGFIEQQRTKGPMYVKRFVDGMWTPDTFTEGNVFDEAFIMKWIPRKAIKEVNGIKIYEDPEMCEYQIGVDPSLGSADPGHICVVNKNNGHVVATFSGYVNTDTLVDRTVQLANMYSLKAYPRVVPERTGVGQSYVDNLKKHYDNIYLERKVNTISKNRVTEKLGFNTSYGSKLQLIDNFKTLLENKFVSIPDSATIQEFKMFQYTDEAAKKGAGAPSGFHDDKVMGTLLAYWELKPTEQKENWILEELKKIKKTARRERSHVNSAR